MSKKTVHCMCQYRPTVKSECHTWDGLASKYVGYMSIYVHVAGRILHDKMVIYGRVLLAKDCFLPFCVLLPTI